MCVSWQVACTVCIEDCFITLDKVMLIASVESQSAIMLELYGVSSGDHTPAGVSCCVLRYKPCFYVYLPFGAAYSNSVFVVACRMCLVCMAC